MSQKQIYSILLADQPLLYQNCLVASKRIKELKLKRQEINKKIKRINAKNSKGNQKELSTLKTELKKLDKSLAQEENKIDQIDTDLEESQKVIDRQLITLKEHEEKLRIGLKYIYTSDFENLCKIVDPSQQLIEYFAQLIENFNLIEKDPKNSTYINISMELRFSIRKILANKII